MRPAACSFSSFLYSFSDFYLFGFVEELTGVVHAKKCYIHLWGLTLFCCTRVIQSILWCSTSSWRKIVLTGVDKRCGRTVIVKTYSQVGTSSRWAELLCRFRDTVGQYGHFGGGTVTVEYFVAEIL